MKVEVVHGILWSKYKAGVFSELARVSRDHGIDVRFCQIAETDVDRMGLSKVDLSCHRYDYVLLFHGAYSRVPKLELCAKTFVHVFRSDARAIVLPGFNDLAHWSMLLAALLSGKRRMVVCDSTLRDRSQSRLKGLFKRLFFSLCDGFFTYGRRGREYLLNYGARAERIVQRVQAAALPADYQRVAVVAARVRSAALRLQSSPVFLYVGRLSPEKSIDVLLRGFFRLLQTFPGARLRIVGSGISKDDLVRLKDALGLESQVEFLGSMDLQELAKEYLGATCFVLPSKSEPWGLVVNEALHFGCPVIVSDNCGCVPELVVEGVSGYSFEPGNEAELCSRMVEAASNFRDAEQTAHDCLKVVSPFTAERSATQMIIGMQLVAGVP